jgi:hypothetical protein
MEQKEEKKKKKNENLRKARIAEAMRKNIERRKISKKATDKNE